MDRMMDRVIAPARTLAQWRRMPGQLFVTPLGALWLVMLVPLLILCG